LGPEIKQNLLTKSIGRLGKNRAGSSAFIGIQIVSVGTQQRNVGKLL